MSYEEFLAIEEEPGLHYEWHKGVFRAMTRSKPTHGRIVMVVGSLLDRIAREDCDVFDGDVPLFVETEQLHTYADIFVVCGPLITRVVTDKNKKIMGEAVINPTIIVEVLSDSTARYDRGAKFDAYKQLHSLMEYVLVAQDERHVEVRTRGEGDAWTTQTGGPDDSVRIHGHDVHVASFYVRQRAAD